MIIVQVVVGISLINVFLMIFIIIDNFKLNSSACAHFSSKVLTGGQRFICHVTRSGFVSYERISLV